MAKNTLDILQSTNKNVYWDNYWDNIEEGVTKYKAKLANNKREAEQHLNNILPIYWEVFYTHNAYQRGTDLLPSNACYDVGIFLVGFSSLPIVLSVAELQPWREIYFLYSSETVNSSVNMLQEIKQRVEAMLPHKSPLVKLISKSVNTGSKFAVQINDASDPVTTFKHIKEIIDKVRSNHGTSTRIALDVTSGKKTMIGGGFTAGSIYSLSPKCDMFYVDSREYNPSLREPKPGTEFLSRLDNPYDIYNVQAVREAEKLFKAYNYEAAAVLWDDVSKKLDDPAGRLQSPAERYSLTDERDTAEKNRDMATCYRFWDAFDYEQAKQNKGTYKLECNKKHTHKRTDGSTTDILQILSEMTTAEQLFTSNEARVIHYVVDRYQNGMRRKKAGEFVDAIVRFTQVVELLCIYKMYQLQKNNHLIIDRSSGTIVSQSDLNNEEWSISRLIRFLFGEFHSYYAYDEDWVLRCSHLNVRDYGTFTKPDEIVKLISPRNEFIHVNKSMRQKDNQRNSKNLQEFALKFLEKSSANYCSEIDLPFKQLLELHEFRQL